MGAAITNRLGMPLTLLLACGILSPCSAQDPQQFFQQFLADKPAEERDLKDIDISAAEEKRVGDQMARQYLETLERQNVDVVSRGGDVEYLERLAETLKKYMKNGRRYQRIKIYLARSPRTDARSFPGGTLVFFEGLLDFAENEAALVGVMGHELSHLDHQHQLRTTRQMTLAQQAFSQQGGFDFEKMQSAAMSMAKIWTAPFRPQDEEQADLDGAEWAAKAGYDPREMAHLFLRMHQRDKGKNQPEIAFLRTHPFLMDRHRAVMNMARRFPRRAQDNWIIGRENLKRRVTAGQQRFPEKP